MPALVFCRGMQSFQAHVSLFRPDSVLVCWLHHSIMKATGIFGKLIAHCVAMTHCYCL